VEGEESMMDHIERKGKILVALTLYWCLHMIVQHVLNMQAMTLNGEWENALILSICFEGMKMNYRSVWAFERNVGFTDRLLLGSLTEKMFKRKTRVCHNTFKFLCQRLGSYLQKKNIHMKETNSVESIFATSSQRLGTGNTLCIVGEVSIEESLSITTGRCDLAIATHARKMIKNLFVVVHPEVLDND
jgi:hypothetical protein